MAALRRHQRTERKRRRLGVTQQDPATPAFGEADLSNCEREQIHLAGSIQPHGALLVLQEPELLIIQSSTNAGAFLNCESVLGMRLDDIEGDLAEKVRRHLDDRMDRIPIAVRCHLGSPARDFDGLLHRPPQGGLIVELEEAGASLNLSKHLEGSLRKILETVSLSELCNEAATIFKELTGFDRIMVYRFDEEGHGEVFAERREEHLEPYLGNRYPASDIPQIARRLYERNRVRVLVDVDYEPVPLDPLLSPLTGEDLDMSLCTLRSMSPIHIQYLQNMGVNATLVASLMVAGRLWGLVSCHHYAPLSVPYETRVVVELLAETVATRLAALESFVQAEAELMVQRLEQRLVEAISRDGDWKSALFEHARSLLQPLDAGGAALLFEGEVRTTGEVPGTHELRRIGAWLDAQTPKGEVAVASLGLVDPAFATLKPVASGLLAMPLSRAPGEYLIWFRPERIRTVTWGGNPFKPVIVGNDPSDLSPRRSFSQWHQVVEGTADPWTPANLNAARLIGSTLADVVLQFRSVRMVIAQQQLEQVSDKVKLSEQPVITATPDGRILLINAAFKRLMNAELQEIASVNDLPALFAESDAVRRSLDDLLRHRNIWRGEVRLLLQQNEAVPLRVRADAVMSAPDQVLGFVFLFTDLTERKAAENARRSFQEGLIGRHQMHGLQLNSKADLLYRNLLSSVVGNAQLAALEITDSMELAQIPAKLESVQASVARSRELLEHLMWHAMFDGGAETSEDPEEEG